SIKELEQLTAKYPVTDISPLTPMQEGMLFHSLAAPGSRVYCMQSSFRLNAHWESSCLERSFRELVKRYDILRTVFLNEGFERPLQLVQQEVEVDYRFDDLTVPGEGAHQDREAVIAGFRERYREQTFDLARGPLVRLGVMRVEPAIFELNWSFHHILMDGWCIGILFGDFLEIYNRLSQGKTGALAKPASYRKYIEWLEKQDGDRPKEYWSHYLKGYEEPAVIPRHNNYEGDKDGFDNRCFTLRLERQKTAALNRMAGKNQVTLNTVMQAAWGITLGKYTGKRDVVFGGVVSGRPSEIKDVESIVGLFINTIPIRISFEKGISFDRLLHVVRDKAIAGEANHYYPLAEIQAGSALKQRLLDHFLVFENYPIPEKVMESMDSGKDAPVEISEIDSSVYTNYGFYVTVIPGEQLIIKLNYNADIYESELINGMGNHLNDVLSQTINNDKITIDELNLISEARQKRISSRMNEELEKEVAAMGLEDSVFQKPLLDGLSKGKDKIAIEYGSRAMTYNELEKRSNYIANRILNKGVERETFIGILTDDRMELIIMIVGILKAGCVFIPLDLKHPRNMIETMIRLTGIKLIFMDKNNPRGFDENDTIETHQVQFESINSFVPREEESRFTNRRDIGYSPGDKVYAYFTSGSTGLPKAIIGKNRSLLQFIQWEVEAFKITADFRISQLITPGFDPFLRDIFVTLFAGGTICIPGNMEIIINPEKLINWIDRHRIFLLQCVPGIFRLINSKPLSKDNFKELKYVMLMGEKTNPNDIVKWFDVFDEAIQLVNLYGPTETTLAKVSYLIRKSDVKRERIPIGKPIKGARVVILDENLTLCEKFVKGEICILTPFASFGYCNSPQLNREKFIKNPFNDTPDYSLYRTGDLGQILSDGNIDILGRIDRQVKIRGIRIELEGIESALSKHPAVKEAVVIKRETNAGSVILVAYITVAGDAEKPVPVNIKRYLAERLPDYMVPSKLLIIDTIPRNANGKIDFNSLPEQDEDEAYTYLHPRNNVEKRLSELWNEVLKSDGGGPGIRKSFFELGGTSLNVMALITKIHKEFEVKLLIRELFSNPTIEMQAALITQTRIDIYVTVEPVEKKEYYFLSSAQKRLYVLQQLNLENIAYNMPQMAVLEGELESERFAETIKKVMKRHESLRSSFHMLNEEPAQRIYNNDIEFQVESYTILEKCTEFKDVEEIINGFVRPFNLDKAPLFRVGLIKKEVEKY
ncbi:MAG: amino acid adenylation domain-containing protein, partial [bacterium]|nr:amino acid adenylation domain-containing protein [bacterium]